MGVVYKLKKEVAEFILQQKLNDPQLSCRRFVDLVEEHFHLTLSKSSINALLKKAHLSSPIGRRRALGQKRAGKFQIPNERKEILFENTTQSKVPAETLVVNNGTIRPRLFDGMGCIFLKAAEWELSDSSILGKILRLHLKDNNDAQVDAISEVLLFLKLFGIKKIEDLHSYKGDGLWVLNGLNKNSIQAEDIQKILSEGIDEKGLTLDFSLEINQITAEINYIKIFLKDGSELILDARLACVWKPGILPPFFSPVTKVMRIIAKQFLNNIEPVVMVSRYICETSKDFSQEFGNLVRAFDSSPEKQVKKIAVYDNRGQEIAFFDQIPEQKRVFITAVWPEESFFQKLTLLDAHQKYKYIKINELGEECYFYETTTSIDDLLEKIPLRVFFIKKASQLQPTIALLTNAPLERLSFTNVLIYYLLRWNNLQKKPDFLTQKHQLPLSDVSSQLSRGYAFIHLTEFFKNLLVQYCKNYFFLPQFDINNLLSSIYNISGQIMEDKLCIQVNFFLSESKCLFFKDLKFAVQKINESAVYNRNNQKLIVNIIREE